MVDFTASVTVPASFDSRVMKRYALKYQEKVKQDLRKELEIQRRMFKKTTTTWRHSVYFNITIEEYGDRVSGFVSTDDKIWGYLEKGTWNRHAVMHNDFKPKSKRKVLGSSVGAHPDPVFISRGIMMPGILPRHWRYEVYDRRKNRFFIEFNKTFVTYWNKSMRYGKKHGYG